MSHPIPNNSQRLRQHLEAAEHQYLTSAIRLYRGHFALLGLLIGLWSAARVGDVL